MDFMMMDTDKLIAFVMEQRQQDPDDKQRALLECAREEMNRRVWVLKEEIRRRERELEASRRRTSLLMEQINRCQEESEE